MMVCETCLQFDDQAHEGSEVWRLRQIIRDLDQRNQRSLEQRNDLLRALNQIFDDHNDDPDPAFQDVCDLIVEVKQEAGFY